LPQVNQEDAWKREKKGTFFIGERAGKRHGWYEREGEKGKNQALSLPKEKGYERGEELTCAMAAEEKQLNRSQ